MSVLRLTDVESAEFAAERTGGNHECCHFCGKPLEDFVVLWQQRGATALYHPDCGVDFALAILFDSQRAQALATGQSLEAGMGGALWGRQPTIWKKAA